jgi:hypothetical protein
MTRTAACNIIKRNKDVVKIAYIVTGQRGCNSLSYKSPSLSHKGDKSLFLFTTTQKGQFASLTGGHYKRENLMKKLILFVYAHILIAAPECMDNSYHLTQPIDHRDYHHVACNCPCEKQYKILDQRGICTKCGHFRDPYASRLKKYIPLKLCLKNNTNRS